MNCSCPRLAVIGLLASTSLGWAADVLLGHKHSNAEASGQVIIGLDRAVEGYLPLAVVLQRGNDAWTGSAFAPLYDSAVRPVDPSKLTITADSITGEIRLSSATAACAIRITARRDGNAWVGSYTGATLRGR
jgi:hypothetical protein